MSDISLTFSWYELLLIGAVIGLPGAIIGLAVGVLALHRRRGWGALAGAVLGDTLWVGALVMIH
jgi:hypothetical protein